MAKLNVNKASQQELDEHPSLHGHGFEIVRYRDGRGAFQSLRQLDEVPGLAGKLDAAALENLTV